MEHKDWIIRFFDKDDNLINSHIIKDRTQYEAEEQAMMEMSYEYDDWTLVEYNF